MADDIDIEEHDLMDNPQIRHIFPDLSILKQELQHFDFEGASLVKQEPAPATSHSKNSLRNTDTGIGNLKLTSDYANDKVTNSRLISELQRPLSTVKTVDNPENGTILEDVSEIKMQQLPCSNKIILGSKLAKQLHYEDFFEKQVKSNELKVVLDDLGPYLKRSNRYCVTCLILFPNKIALEVHKETEHLAHDTNLGLKIRKRVLKRQKSYECKKFKCTFCSIYCSTRGNLQRHYKNKHLVKKGTDIIKKVRNRIQNNLQVDKNLICGADNTCFHCKISFPTQQSLIEHIYSILQCKRISCKICLKKFSNGKRLKEHMLIHDTNQIKNHKNIKTNISEIRPSKDDKPKPAKSTESLYYRCYICSYYFKNATFCSTHITNKHKVTKYPKIIGVTYMSKCVYCSQNLTNVCAYNTHLKQCHYKEYSVNLKNKITSKKNVKANVFKPYCEPTDGLYQSVSKDTPLVFSSTLFKCIKCDIYFTSAGVAMDHSAHMEMLVNWKCTTCQRIFKKEDEILHVKQHSFTDIFITKQLSSAELSRVLYSCPKCVIHFAENNFTSHYAVCGIETPESMYCNECDILVEDAIGLYHKSGHILENLKSSDYTVILLDNIPNNENMDTDNQESQPLKRKIDHGTNVPYKKDRSDVNYMLQMSYCNTCKCFITDLSKVHNIHLQSRCAQLTKYVCKICGLVLTAKAYQTHKSQHTKTSLKLQDFIFYELESGKQICPPIPEFPKCSVCEVSFVSKIASKRHECSDENYLTCHICDINLSEGAFKLHMSFHNYSMMNFKNPIDKSKTHTEANDIDNASLIQSTEKFKPLLNNSKDLPNNDLPDPGFIFSCRDCNITVDSYDKVVEHCQGHYYYKEKQINTERCNICDLKFDSTCFETHELLHSSLFDKIKFKFLKFDPFYFTSENDIWIKHFFGSLPHNEVAEILGASIYKYECRIKMEVIQDGPSDLTVYKCHSCRCFIVDGSLLYQHAENSCFKLRKHPCSFCGLPFLSSVSRLEHEKIHKRPNISLKSYRIVLFNNEEDRALNSATYCNRPYILYQCRNCDGVVDKSRIKDHECDKKCLKKCNHCGLLLHKKGYNHHVTRHRELIRFTCDNMKVILFGDRQNDSGGVVSSFSGTVLDYTFYSCSKCQVCVKTLHCTSKHRCARDASILKCPICGLYFDASNIKYHRKLHGTDPEFYRENMRIIAFDYEHETEKSKEYISTKLSVAVKNTGDSNSKGTIKDDSNNRTYNDDSEVVSNTQSRPKENENYCDFIEKIAQLYKCTCGLHFLDESSITTHFKICSPKIRASKQKCAKCKLLFTPNILFSHLLMHHGNKKHVYKFDIIEIDKTKKDLYKCARCNLHFLKENDTKVHYKTCNFTERGSKCQVCLLTFDNSSLLLHNDCRYKDWSKHYEIREIGVRLVLPKDSQDAPKEADNTNHLLNRIKAEIRDCNKTVYKCKTCGIHFMTKKSIRFHLSETHETLAKLQDICSICGLNFIPTMLPKHITFHHDKLNLTSEDLIVVECRENV